MRIIAAEQGTTPPELTPEAQELLKQYRWPGNVRELRNICERIVVMSSSRTVDQSTLMDLHIFRNCRRSLPDSRRLRQSPFR